LSYPGSLILCEFFYTIFSGDCNKRLQNCPSFRLEYPL
jgi:hypothetical protein